MGSAAKALVNDLGYPIVLDLGLQDPSESFKLSVKFADTESRDNCAAIRIKFVLSDIPGDIGSIYEYYVIGEETNVGSMTPGAWEQIQIFKSDFYFENNGGSVWPDLGWNTITAIIIEIELKDPASGGKSCSVSFDNLYYSPIGKLDGSDLQWTYTYYNSLTDTESDFADTFLNPLGFLSSAKVELQFPATPYTNPPLANPNKIRIYRMGGTVTQFQRVDEIIYVPGFPFTYIDNIPDSMLEEALEDDNQLPPDGVIGCEIYDNRLWTWGGIQNGIVEPLNRLRFSKGTRIEHFPASNYIYVGSGNEQIQRVLEHDGELFIFTLTKVYRVVGQNETSYRAVSTAVNQGLTNRFCACRGPHGLFMRAYDGIYEFPSGRKISEPINQIFFGENVNGIEPIAAGRAPEESMGFYDSKLFFSYCATTDPTIRNDRTLIWDIIYERWAWYIYGAQSLFTEPENNILVGCNLTQWYTLIEGIPGDTRRSGNFPMRLEYGHSDQCDVGFRGIPCIIDTKEYDLGSPDQEKQFIDLTVDADTQGYPITVEGSFDGQPHESLGIIQTTERARTVLPIVMGDENSKMAVRLSLRIMFESAIGATSSTRIYKIAHRILVEPPRHGTYVTDWSNYGSPGPKYFHKLWIEMETFGIPLTEIEIQIDQTIAKTLTENLSTLGRQKLYYGLGIDHRGTLARLKFVTDGEHEIKVYDHGFDFIPEPPLINSLQMPWTDNGWPYRKLWKHIELDIDTEGKLIEFNFWLDGAISQTFSVVTNVREHVIQSLNQEQFGKLARLTVDVNPIGTDGLLQGVRIYADPIYMTDQRNPEVTVSDSFEQTLANDRIKVLRRIWYVIDNPNEVVTLRIYMDNVLKGTFSIPNTNSITPKLEMRRLDMPGGFKGRYMRFVFTSGQAFEIDWKTCEFLLRDINTEDGYRPPRLEPPATY